MISTSSSEKSSAATTMEDDRSENRDSCYFPGCRKDANCNCEICLASINATLDLMPMSIQKSSLTKFSASPSRPNVERTPISFDSSVVTTPRSSTCENLVSPVLKSTARFDLHEKMEKTKKMKKKKREWRIGGKFFSMVLCLNLILAAEFGFSWLVSGILQPVFSPDVVRSVGEESWAVKDLNEKFRFLQKEIRGFVDGKISNCSFLDSIWKVNQDGSVLNSRCTLYKSTMEEISIWGWPLQTAGLLTTGYSSRSFTILSGRVTEWCDGKVGFLIRKGNNSWVQGKWGASVVQLDPNTWVLEYRRSSVLETPGLLTVAAEFLRFRMSRKFWIFSALHNQISEFTRGNDIKIPT